MRQLIQSSSGRVCSVILESERSERRAPLYWRLAYCFDKFIVI